MKKTIYGAEEFSFGGSFKGGIVSLKAKIKDMVSDDQGDITRYATLSGQLLERLGKLEEEMKTKKGEYQKDVAQIPIGSTVRSLWCDGKLVTKPAAILENMKELTTLLRARETVIYPQFKKFLAQYSELLHGLLADKDITNKDLTDLLKILDLSKDKAVGEKEFIGNVTTGLMENKIYGADISFVGYSHKKPPVKTDAKIEAFTREACQKFLPVCHEIASLNNNWFRNNGGRPKAVQKIVGTEITNVMDMLGKLDAMSHPKAEQLIRLYNGVIDVYHESFGALAAATNETAAAVTRLMEMSARRWY